jgi:hypothetical protein
VSNGGFDFGGIFDALLSELGSVVAAIISFLQSLVQQLVAALNFLFATDQGIFGFSFAGQATILKWLKSIWDALQKTVFGSLLLHLKDLFGKLQDFVKKLKAWLDKLQQIKKKYEMAYFRKVIQILSRARKILTIFRFFHLKFAQRLDNWLATVEGRIAHYQILMGQKLNEITAWVNLVVDPRGALRTFPLVAGIIAALDQTWIGIFGTPFSTSFLGSYSRGRTGSVQVTVNQTVADVKSGTGDAGMIAQSLPDLQREFAKEMGLQ